VIHQSVSIQVSGLSEDCIASMICSYLSNSVASSGERMGTI